MNKTNLKPRLEELNYPEKELDESLMDGKKLVTRFIIDCDEDQADQIQERLNDSLSDFDGVNARKIEKTIDL